MRPRKRQKRTPAEGLWPLGSTGGEKSPAGLVCLGVVLGAHGVRGAVRIKSFAMNVSDIAAYGPLQSEDGSARFALTLRGVSRGAVLAEIDGIDRREAAEALQGTPLYVPRAALPDTEEDEYYHADLIGLSARTVSGELYGVVRGIYDYGAGDVIEIDRVNDASIIFPFTREIVPDIDLASGSLVIDPPTEIDAGDADPAEKFGPESLGPEKP
ncbi:MAG: ribosome maturation factor RimM [Proteobacteria bacterium]|nr:ribosome maturation factor RimM [Pseudomonadota bacterium]MDA1355481.1 ribosome maturation factor RimM [Pseudomonadota bacterium]